MLPDKYTYLALMLLSLAYPLAQSFEKRVFLWKRWKFMFPAILITAAFFIVWDIFFTITGVWSFNPKYVTGVYLIRMPIEEWLFFFIVPYCCFFVYFVCNYFIKKDVLGPYQKNVTLFFAIFTGIVGIVFFDRWYTAVASLASSVLLFYLYFLTDVKWLGRFFVGYFVSLIPFLMVNGILTAWPVVEYNDAENLGIRIFIDGWANIPIDDTIYCLLLLLMNVSLYHYFENRAGVNLPLTKD